MKEKKTVETLKDSEAIEKDLKNRNMLSGKTAEVLGKYRNRKTFSDIINGILVEKNMQNSDFAKRIYVDKSLVTKYLAKGQLPSLNTIKTIHVEFGVKIDDLILAVDPELWVIMQARELSIDDEKAILDAFGFDF